MAIRKKYYQGLRDYLKTLEEHGKLLRIKRLINKDTELMPLVRWQFRGLKEEQRRAFLFENVTDITGRKYDIPVAVATHAGSREIYALAMNCQPEEIQDRWINAQLYPIGPELVKEGPAQEVVLEGQDLTKEGSGLDIFPVPISTPGFDPAPFFSAACWVTKDPDTGIPNLGTYRAQVKSRTRTGIQCVPGQDLTVHWKKAKERGQALEAALILGGPPCIGLVSVSKIPYEANEFAVAGGIAGEPIKIVKCKSVELEVPATAEIVLEGHLSTEEIEPEAPFGEYTGYMGHRTRSPYFEISCLTHRRAPILHAFISQFPPSESSKIREISQEATLFKFLKYDCNIPGILEVAFHEESGTHAIWVIRLKKVNAQQPWQALNCAAGYSSMMGKIIIAVDEDINPKDPDSFLWAIGYRVQPHVDVRPVPGKLLGLDPSAMPPGPLVPGEFVLQPLKSETSGLLIDATRKWDYPPISLPKREYMERAKVIWEELGLPPLTPKVPWFGYSLGLWSQENEEEAELALQGQHYLTGERLIRARQKV